MRGASAMSPCCSVARSSAPPRKAPARRCTWRRRPNSNRSPVPTSYRRCPRPPRSRRWIWPPPFACGTRARSCCKGDESDRVGAALARADARDRLDGCDPDLAVADLVGAGARFDRIDGCIDDVIVHDDLDLALGGEQHFVLGAPVRLAVSALASETLHLRDGHPGYADGGERVFHVIELERFDNCGDEFHLGSPCRDVVVTTQNGSCI